MLKFIGRAYSAGQRYEKFTAPAGFLAAWNFLTLFEIEESGRKYRTTFAPQDYANPAGTTYYVDPVNGSNSNNGLSWATAFATVSYAAAASNASVLYLAAGIYDKFDTFGSTGTLTLTRDMALIAPSGKAYFTTSNDKAFAWAQNGTYSHVYQTPSYPPAEICIDYTNLDSEGYPIPLKEQSSLANVAATANSYYRDGTALYVNTFDSREPAATDILMFRGNIPNGSVVGNYTLYVKNIGFYGGYASFDYNTTNGTSAAIIAEDCEFMYSNGNGFVVDDLSFAYAKNCKAKYNKLDGFSCNGTVSAGNHVFDHCVSTDNGLESFIGVLGDDYDNNCNGFTTHNACNMILLNCVGDRTDGPIVAHVDTTQTLVLGTYAGESNATAQGSTNDVSFNVSAGATMYMKNCESGASYYGRNTTGTIVDLGGYIEGSLNGDNGTIS